VTVLLFETVFYPLSRYAERDLPGALTFQTFALWCHFRGQGKSRTWVETKAAPATLRRFSEQQASNGESPAAVTRPDDPGLN